MNKQNLFIISLVVSAAWCGYANGQAAPDGKSVITASRSCVRAPKACPPPLLPCVPSPLLGPPPMCPVPPPEVYCEHPVQRTTRARTPDEVHAYYVGRLPNGEGGMDEAHIYYRIVQSAHWDLRLPVKNRASGVTTGPQGVFYPPTYQAPPKDQQVRDAVSAADQQRLAMEQAEANFNNATDEIRKKLQEDNQLKDEIQDLLEQNKRLREQLQKEPETRPSPSPTQSSASTDALRQWGNQLTRANGPSPTSVPTE